MNFRAVLIAGALAAIAVAGAQGGKPGGPGGQGGPGGPGGMRRQMMTPEQRLAKMTKDLNLTAAQQKKIKPLLESNAKKGKEVFADKKLTDAQKRDAFMKMRDAYRKQLAKILTPDQMKKMDAMRRRGPGGPGGPGGRGPGGPAGAPPKGGKGGH